MLLCGHQVGLDQPLFLIAGPCAIESESLALLTAERLRQIAEKLGFMVIYKSSFDKANRSSGKSFRGPGMEEGLRILERVRKDTGLPVLTDVHTEDQVLSAADVVDVLQTPAFLARQTDFIAAVAASGKPANIKKAQFLAPWDMVHVIDKARASAAAAGLETDNFLVCERGAMFGYNNLVSDMRSLSIMRETRCPVTHSVQLPGGQGDRSGGQREFVPLLARSAVAAGISGLFMETHPDPDQALSDGLNAWPLHLMEPLLCDLLAIDATVKASKLTFGEAE